MKNTFCEIEQKKIIFLEFFTQSVLKTLVSELETNRRKYRVVLKIIFFKNDLQMARPSTHSSVNTLFFQKKNDF